MIGNTTPLEGGGSNVCSPTLLNISLIISDVSRSPNVVRS